MLGGLALGSGNCFLRLRACFTEALGEVLELGLMLEEGAPEALPPEEVGSLPDGPHER